MAINFDRLEGQSCGECLHFFADDKEGQPGQCRYGPPLVITLTKQGVQERFNRVTKLVERTPSQQMTMQTMFPMLAANDLGCHCFEGVRNAKEKDD